MLHRLGPYRSALDGESGSGSKGQEDSELYQDLEAFTETKRKIEALIRFKQALIDQEHSDFTTNAIVFAQYKLQALDAINQHFDSLRPSGS